ncbi:hypothetical protein [Mumia quercus]|uniref:hypothetical protein n=1 Tax=Mumia quercus TaxID=2976125 RepID=UPI0021D3D83E|nr:hypothetical protein [Mumia quercus]
MTGTAPGAADLDAIWAALENEHVYVHPSMKGEVTAPQLAEAKANIARSEAPVYVVVYPLHPDDEFTGEPSDLVATLHDHRPEPGIYLATDVRWDRNKLDGASWDVRTEDRDPVYQASFAAEIEEPDDLGAQVVAATEMIADGTTQERYDKAWAVYEKTLEKRETSTGSQQPSSYADDDGAGGALPWVVGAVLLATALALAWRAFRKERGDAASDRKAFTLPASVVERVRDAHDSALIARADRELLALGELIDETELAGDTAAWQTALDHYDAAKRVRGESRQPDVLDVVGALVLVERGGAALAAAAAGKPYEPARPCYLNPLHGTAAGSTPLATERGKVVVPLCAQCRRDLKAKRRPDILDVVRGGKPVHYFDSGVEPWASTGYGALDPDLVTQLHRTRR